MTSSKTTIKLITRNGLVCYHILKKKKICFSKIQKALIEADLEKIEAWIAEYQDLKDAPYRKQYTKLDCLDEILALNKNRYDHLHSIRNVVQMDTIVNKIVDEKTYQKNLSLHYASQFLEEIVKGNDYLEKIYLPLLNQEKENCFHLVTKKINKYYIDMITR